MMEGSCWGLIPECPQGKLVRVFVYVSSSMYRILSFLKSVVFFILKLKNKHPTSHFPCICPLLCSSIITSP